MQNNTPASQISSRTHDLAWAGKSSALALCLIVGAVSGCSSMPNKVQKFVASLPAIDAKEVKQDFSCPLWSNSESASDLTVADGALKVGLASASFKIPLWGVVTSASISGVSIKPSAEQVVSAQEIQAAVAAAAAKTRP